VSPAWKLAGWAVIVSTLNPANLYALFGGKNMLQSRLSIRCLLLLAGLAPARLCAIAPNPVQSTQRLPDGLQLTLEKKNGRTLPLKTVSK
jgi:hypothetical protein